MCLFRKSTGINFSGKSDSQILKIYRGLEEKQKRELLDFLLEEIVIIGEVAAIKGIPLDRYNLVKEIKDFSQSKYYGMKTYGELRRVYDVIIEN